MTYCLFLVPENRPNTNSLEYVVLCVFSVVAAYRCLRVYNLITFFTGIYETSFIKPFLAKDFLSQMKDEQKSEWSAKFGKSASESLREFALEYVGKPINDMLRYGFFDTDISNIFRITNRHAWSAKRLGAKKPQSEIK